MSRYRWMNFSNFMNIFFFVLFVFTIYFNQFVRLKAMWMVDELMDNIAQCIAVAIFRSHYRPDDNSIIIHFYGLDCFIAGMFFLPFHVKNMYYQI